MIRSIAINQIQQYTILLILTLSTYVQSEESVTKNEITWHFDQDYKIGQYINGDYYVIAPNGITITATEPASIGAPQYNHGTTINPVTNLAHGYENRLANWNNEKWLGDNFPAQPGDSIVKVISLTDSDFEDGYYTPSWTGLRTKSNHSKIKSAEVLTVVSEEPPEDSFRPPFVGETKPTYRFSQTMTNILPRLPAPQSLSSGYLRQMQRGLERPWLTHNFDWTSREMHPLENMFNYHSYIARFTSDATMALMTDAYSQELLTNYIQTGIDQYHMSILGEGDSALFNFHIILTGLLLDKPDIYNVFKENRNITKARTRDLFYYIGEGYAETDATETWTGKRAAFRKNVRYEHEHLHPSRWIEVEGGGGAKQESYRTGIDSHVHVGYVFAAILLGETDKLNHPALTDYIDRWMTEDYATEWLPIVRNHTGGGGSGYTQRSGTTFIDELWENYRNLAPLELNTNRPNDPGPLQPPNE